MKTTWLQYNPVMERIEVKSLEKANAGICWCSLLFGAIWRNSKWLQKLLLCNYCISFVSFGEWSQPVLVPVPETGSIISDRLLLPMSAGSPASPPAPLRSGTFFSLTATTGFIPSPLNCPIVQVKKGDGQGGEKVLGVLKATVFQDKMWEYTKIISDFKSFLRG